MSHRQLTILSTSILAVFGYIMVVGLPVKPSAAEAAVPDVTPTPFDPSAIDFSKISQEDIEATERHRDELRAQAKTKLEEQAAVVADQSKTLKDIKAANEATKKSFETYQAAAEAQIERGNKAIAALDHVLKKLHLAKWIASGLVLIVAAFVALKVPAFGVYVGAAVATAGIAAVWIWL